MSRRLDFNFHFQPPELRPQLIKEILSATSTEDYVKAVKAYRYGIFSRDHTNCMEPLSAHDEADKGALLAMSKCL